MGKDVEGARVGKGQAAWDPKAVKGQSLEPGDCVVPIFCHAVGELVVTDRVSRHVHPGGKSVKSVAASKSSAVFL